jgi:hypothetical protein
LEERTLKEKSVIAIKKIMVEIICVLLFLSLSLLIAVLISHFSGSLLRTVMVYEGFIIVLVGALLSPRGSRSIINLNALEQRNAEYMIRQDLEINRLEQELERKDPSYYKNFFSRVKGSPHNLTLILSGGIILFYALIYL